jgi:hypothetical protein
MVDRREARALIFWFFFIKEKEQINLFMTLRLKRKTNGLFFLMFIDSSPTDQNVITGNPDIHRGGAVIRPFLTGQTQIASFHSQ